MMTRAELAKMIDQTLLKPQTTGEQMRKFLEECAEYGFCSAAINAWFVDLAKEVLDGSGVLIDPAVGFPLGAMTTAAKAFEAEEAAKKGADEIDMVMNIGALKGGNHKRVLDDIRAVKQAIGSDIPLKVILETCYLTRDEKITACKLVVDAGADFVKTSTGFAEGGATVEDIKLMRETVGPDFGVKAAGGIRSLDKALAMIEAGANRIGVSKGVEIVSALKE